jgi:hypothetical protein
MYVMREGVVQPFWSIFMVGQDIDTGTRIEFAPAARSEARRSTEQVKLRLPPADALRLRAAAAERGLEVSAYVALLLDDPRRPLVPPPASSELPLAEVSRLAGLLGLLPEEVRRSRGELGQAFGLLKHLFESPASALNAERHAYALAEATRERRSPTSTRPSSDSSTSSPRFVRTSL